MLTCMRRGLGAMAAITWLVLLASRSSAQPPSNHDQQLGVPGVITGLHAAGYQDPLNNNCALCHGAELTGGFAFSCYLCHGAFWDSSLPQYPSSHTHEVRGNRAHSPREADCMFCHDVFGDLFKKTSFWHAPGHGTPYESGCTQCHGAHLDGEQAIAYSCYWCHDRFWAGEGPPVDHTVELGGFAQHKPGYAQPESSGCGQCHGENLNDGFAPSCFSCHGPGGQGLPEDHTILKGGFALHRAGYEDPYSNCVACHGPNLDDGFATSCLKCHGTGGVGAPADHTVELGGFALHRPGYTEPEDAGCANCHGPDLRGGLGPSCYACHRREWADHDFAGEPWLPAGEAACLPCHDLTLSWNHELPSSTFQVTTTTVAQVGQPTGNSARCLGCHEGRPNGPAIDDFGGNTNGSEFMFGGEAFGTDLTHHHPVSFQYDGVLAAVQGGLNDPATTLSGLTAQGTVSDDMLQAGSMECTSCHDPHSYEFGQFLVAPIDGGDGLCFKCHTTPGRTVGQHHIPGRTDPWGEARGTRFTCVMCHGADLEGQGPAPGCMACHNDFTFPDSPEPGHHMGDRSRPYFECAACHADPDTRVLTGSSFAPSCFSCHGDIWNLAGNTPPNGVTIAEAVDVGGIPTVKGSAGQPLTMTAVVATNTEQDPLEYSWSFGDGSPGQATDGDPTVTHTYASESGGLPYPATVWVSDGVNPPTEHRFQVEIEGGATAADTWDVVTAEPDEFAITLEVHQGSLLGFKDNGDLAIGLELARSIYWIELWVDLTGTASWGIGNSYFGTIDRAAGEITGVVLQPDGGIYTFQATAR